MRVVRSGNLLPFVFKLVGHFQFGSGFDGGETAFAHLCIRLFYDYLKQHNAPGSIVFLEIMRVQSELQEVQFTKEISVNHGLSRARPPLPSGWLRGKHRRRPGSVRTRFERLARLNQALRRSGRRGELFFERDKVGRTRVHGQPEYRCRSRGGGRHPLPSRAGSR